MRYDNINRNIALAITNTKIEYCSIWIALKKNTFF